MQSTREVWRDIPGWEDSHQVSDRGNIRSKDRTVFYKTGQRVRYPGKPLRLEASKNGYRMIQIQFGGKAKRFYVHRLVLEAFVGPCPPGMEACHGDGNRENNLLSNLRWDTPSGNYRDQVKHGTHNNFSKTHCKRGHELVPKNLVPSGVKRGQRKCLACSRGQSFAKHNGLTSQVQEITDLYYSQIVQ